MNVRIAGRTTAESDAAVARWLEQFLAREQPGTAWTAGPRQPVRGSGEKAA